MAEETDTIAGPEFNIEVDGKRLEVDIDEVCETAYAVMALLRSLGFPAEDIYFAAGLRSSGFPDDMLFYGVVLEVGAESFVVSLFPRDVVRYTVKTGDGEHSTFCTSNAVMTFWPAYVASLQKKDRLDDAQVARMRKVQQANVGPCLIALRARGFAIPAFERQKARNEFAKACGKDAN